MSDVVNPRVLALFVDAMAANARIAAMTAENQHRMAVDGNISYGESAFIDEANALSSIAEALRNV